MEERDTPILFRTTKEVRERLRALKPLMSEEYGSKLTQTQVLELLISERLNGFEEEQQK